MRWVWEPTRTRPWPRWAWDRLLGMQATVLSFDDQARVTRLVTDDGRELVADGSVFDQSALRLLRPGQRLSVEATLQGESPGTVTSLRIVGVGPNETIH